MKTSIAISALLILAPSISHAAQEHRSNVLGAWASADQVEDCATAPISLFMSDGSMSVFLKAAGPIHAVGVWRLDGDTLYITHNDAPFSTDGKSKPESALTIVELDQDRFVTRNMAGKERNRVRCVDIEITGGGESHGH